MTRTSRPTALVVEGVLEDARSEVVFDLAPAQPFDVFYRRELPGLVALARALSGSSSADDIAQDSMLVAYRHWDTVTSLDVPAAWVRRVCANRCVSTLRRRGVESRALLRLHSRREEPAPMADVHEAFWAEVRRLPRRQAQVIALHYIYDLAVADVASTLGCSEGTVKVHLFRARSVLAERIEHWQGERR
ncbi:MAG: RNA polymerase sigma factor [Actinomycetales bacterium]